MINVFSPEKILADGDDYTIAANPFTGFQGRVRKGTVAATLNNIALLDRLFLNNSEQEQIITITKAVKELIPSLKAIGVFDLFNIKEWVNNLNHPGRVYVAILYLNNYPDEITEEIICVLQEIQKAIPHPLFQSEFQILCKNTL